jgi:hypothetical protein
MTARRRIRAINDEVAVMQTGTIGRRERPESSACFVISALGPLQKLILTFVASGALTRS